MGGGIVSGYQNSENESEVQTKSESNEIIITETTTTTTNDEKIQPKKENIQPELLEVSVEKKIIEASLEKAEALVQSYFLFYS